MNIDRLEVSILNGVVIVDYATEHGPQTLKLTAFGVTDISAGIEDLISIVNTSRPIMQAFASILQKQDTTTDEGVSLPESPSTESPGYSIDDKLYPAGPGR